MDPTPPAEEVHRPEPKKDPRVTSSVCMAPAELGRGIVIPAGSSPPKPWQRAPRVLVDTAALEDPGKVANELHRAWLARRPVVVELAVSPDELRRREAIADRVYTLTPLLNLERERLHFFVWANNYDATRGEPIWWHSRLAQRAGARPHPEAEVDLDGPRWCDGGPRTKLPFAVLHRESIEVGSLALTVPISEVPSDDLDPEQWEAVCHQGGAARVLAPAGSGKTRVLTRRFQHLLECGFEPNRVTALAYNRRAAKELAERCPKGSGSIRTLHSLGYRLLKRYFKRELATEAQVRGVLRSLVQAPPQLNTDPYAPYLEALQTVRLALKEPGQVEAERDDVPGFAELFPRYRHRLESAGLLDFDEQIYGAVELLLREPEVRRHAQQRCTHLLVDEFQDLTPAYLLMIRLLCAPAGQLFAVGDDDQVIYGYAGATPDYLVDFETYFPESSGYLLGTNYRCPPSLVEGANSLLAHNRNRVPKFTKAAGSSPEIPELLLTAPEEQTVRALQQIESWLEEHPPNEIAVLARVNAALMPLQVALQEAGHPHSRVVDKSILHRTGIRAGLAYWRLCTDEEGPWAPEDLADALRRPNRMLRREVLENAVRCRDPKQMMRYALTIDPWPGSQLEEFLRDLQLLKKRAGGGPADFFKALRTQTDFTSALEQLDSAGLGSAGSSHQDDLFALEKVARLCTDEDFEEWLTDHLTGSPGAEKDEGIRLSTVHRVKGLEWPCVLVYGADQGLFPHRLSEEPEEERRIFHVAITRSRHRCALLGHANSLSPFVREMHSPPPAPKQPKPKKKRKRR